LLRVLAFPFGIPHAPGGDILSDDIARVMQTPGEARNRLVADSHVSTLDHDPIGTLEKLLALTPAFQTLEKRLRESKHDPLPQSPDEIGRWAQNAVEHGFIDGNERAMLLEWAALTREAVKVDDFSADFGILEALQRRSAALGLDHETPETV
jgi:acyl-CoA dehydrogenase